MEHDGRKQKCIWSIWLVISDQFSSDHIVVWFVNLSNCGLIARDEDGFVSKEVVRRCCDGSLFEYCAEMNAAIKQRAKMRWTQFSISVVNLMYQNKENLLRTWGICDFIFNSSRPLFLPPLFFVFFFPLHDLSSCTTIFNQRKKKLVERYNKNVFML